MTVQVSDLYGRWLHSYEEDVDGLRHYRRDDYDFLPTRGRDGIEFRIGGVFIDWSIGRDDRNEPVHGHWGLEGDFIHITMDTTGRSRELAIEELTPKILKVREITADNSHAST